MAGMFFLALLLCASSATGQVAEEGRFPVKGEVVPGKPFSLSCPSRLYVAAGESVPFSCTATSVPEEGVRYSWASVSSAGLALLSVSAESHGLSAVFTAPSSGSIADYAYRLTATAAGVYETAVVRVSVEGVGSGEGVEEASGSLPAPACDSFGVFSKARGSCLASEKAPASDFFGDELGEEGIVPWPSFPGSPDGPSGVGGGFSSGGSTGLARAPLLDCPAAVFLEELETGVIACYGSDASGESYLEYYWEPVGGTTRDYLDNPRLIPEDSPSPSVVAPELPRYETLKSFLSGETTFRYLYRLTAMSRATGLSSWREVEVYVSSSRPSVYCPLEVAVEEGAAIALDCTGVDPLSGRMDYDEDGASIQWSWEGLWGTSVSLLDATDRSSVLFWAPAGSGGEAYHYIASMTSSSSGVSRTARRKVTVRVLDAEEVSGHTPPPSIACTDPAPVYEDALDIVLDCSANDAPADAAYSWTGTDSDNRLSATDIVSPTFYVPDNVNADTDYAYTVTLSAAGINDVSDDITVRVLNKPQIDVDCGFGFGWVSIGLVAYEGVPLQIQCSAGGAPAGSTYNYAWTDPGGASDLSLLSATDISSPIFNPPMADVPIRLTYALTVTADNAEDMIFIVNIEVNPLPVVTCTDSAVYEGAADITLSCAVSGANPGFSYSYAWTARGGTPDTDLLSATDVASPTFYVPDEVVSTTTYEYLLTVWLYNVHPGTAEVTVTVLNREALSVACAAPPVVYEGSPDFDLDCEASGAPPGSAYAYAWTALGGASDLSLLSATDVASPTFYVPDEVVSTTTYEYLLTVSAEDADPVTSEVTVTVLNREALSVACAAPPVVYEGSPDFDLDCEASGAPPGSAYAYAWTARGGASDLSLLSATDVASPTFYVPDEVASTTTYEYLLTVSAEDADPVTSEVTVTVLNREALSVACAAPPVVYEGSPDFDLDCEASGAPPGSAYAYAWTALGGASDLSLLSATDVASPTFYVPDEVVSTTTYEYLLTVSSEDADPVTSEVAVTVLNREALSVACAAPPVVYEGSPDFDLDCEASGAPPGSAYAYAWTALGGASDLSLLSATDVASPTFYVPDEVVSTTTYEYLLTVSSEDADPVTSEVTVTVLNREALSVACAAPPVVYEGSPDFDLDCEASGAAPGSAYAYAWTALGGASDLSLLSATDVASPTFYVPDEVASTTTYEYLLTVSAEDADPVTSEVTVTVLNREALSVACAAPPVVYEGSPDFDLDCEASGAPPGSAYAYAWTALGGASDLSLLSATDVASPTFYVPDEVASTTTYEYLLTVSAEDADPVTSEVTVTVLNREALSVACAAPPVVYEGSPDFDLDCEASGAAPGSAYAYAWTALGGASDLSLLSATDVASPTFYVPDEVVSTTTYEYLLTVSSEDADPVTSEVTVTVLNREALSVACAAPPVVYEGSPDFDLDCEASGAPPGSAYAYAWTALGGASDLSLLSATDVASPTFYVPDEVASTTTYEYLLTVSAEDADPVTSEVTVTVLNREALSVACAAPPVVYEGSPDFDLDCEASGAPPGSAYAYAWTALGGASDLSLLSATDVASPTFYVPDEVASTTTYEYLLTVSAEDADPVTSEVTVTVLNRAPLALADDALAGRVYVFTVGERIEDILLPRAAGGFPPYAYALAPALPEGLRLDDSRRAVTGTPLRVSPRTEYAWQASDASDASVSLAFSIEVRPAPEPSPPVAEFSSSGIERPSSLGVTVSASSLRFGVQSADTEVSLDPLTDGISTRVSGPYHAGRMTLSLDGVAAVDENGVMVLSIEVASPALLRRKGGAEAASIVLSPRWSFSESCEQLSSQAAGSLYTEVTLSGGDCRLLHFGGDLDLAEALPGHYAGNLDVVLRSGESEETHSVEVEATVVPAQRVITIGPGGVRFGTLRELPAGLTAEQNLSVYPDVAFLTERKPHGALELSNPSLVPLEISVSARFGYTEATEDGRETVVEEASESLLGDLSSLVDIYPGVLVLQPGEKGLVRYGVGAEALASMAEQGYAAFFDVVSTPRQYVRSDRMPEEVMVGRTARVTMRVPGVYIPGAGASRLRATLLSTSCSGALSAMFLLETADRPFAGEVVAYDGEGRELGRRETLVYTRSRVCIPLARMPEAGTVFLRFSPRGAGRAPAPASVEWDAPGRDIGAAQDRDMQENDRTTTVQALESKQ